MSDVLVTRAELDRLDSMFLILANHRSELTEFLFPDSNAEYRKEWTDREPDKYWFHLDWSNRRRLVQYAVCYYNGRPV